MKPLSFALCLLLACPPGLSAEPRPEDKSSAEAFLAGSPIQNAGAPALEAAVAVQNGLERGETLQAYAERTRLAARGLGLDEESVEKAVQVYSLKAAGFAPGSGASGLEPPANLALSVPDANRERVQRLLNPGAFGPDRVADGGGPGGNPGGVLTAEDFRRLNQQPGAQLPLSLKGPLGDVPALDKPAPEAVPSVTERGYARLREAAAMPDDGSLSTWGQRKWLMGSGLAQTLYGRGTATLGEFADHPIDSAWNAAAAAVDGFSNRMRTDFREVADGYRAFAAAPSFKGAGSLVSSIVMTPVDAATLGLARPVSRGVVAIGHGFVEDFTNVYKDGKALVLAPSASHGAELAASTALLAVNFVGFGTVGAGKTAAKVGGEVLLKEAVEVSVKEGVEQGLKTAVERGTREGLEAATTDAVKQGLATGTKIEGAALVEEAAALKRAAGSASRIPEEVLLENAALLGREERLAAVREQLRLSDDAAAAVLRAHEEIPCAVGGCTPAQLRQKLEIMEAAGIDAPTRRAAIERGLAGDAPEEAVKLVASIRGAIKAAKLPANGGFRYIPSKRYRPGNPLPFEMIGGGEKAFIDRFGNKWVRGPYHGKPGLHTFEWDVQLSEAGKNAWGKFAKKGKNYINVTPDGALSH